jgi:signal transduction histidine kinase
MKLKIWHKMIIGISIPSFIAVSGGIFTYGYINDVKNRQGVVAVADDLKEHVLEIRRNAKNFLHYKHDEQIKSLRDAVSLFSGSISKIPLETVVEVGIGEVSRLKENVEKYSGIIDELDIAFGEKAAITKQVSEEGRKLEALVATNKLAKELSTSFVLHLRLLEKNYMLLRNEKSFRELSSVLSQIKNVTPFCYGCAQYTDSVQNLFRINRQSDSLTDSLQSFGDKIEKITWEASRRERQKINSFIDRSQKLLLSALILLLSLGPFLVYKTASYIVAPIKRIAGITRKISGGDLTLRAPLKEQDETYSLAVSFNTMLDNLQQTQLSLKESLNLLNEKQAQLVESEKRASMGFLVAGVAHELNNPLNNISLRAEIVKEEIRKYSDEMLNNYVQDIVTQSERAHHIINNLLDFARARKSSGMEKQDIVLIVKDSLKLVENQLKVNNIKVEKEIPDGSFYVNGNRSKLEQILISIITNAIQAMKDTGTLTVSVRPDNENRNILIKIKDNGNGIPEDDIKNIFQPFFTTKPPGEGTGLGLAVSHTLVTEHNGEINVESEEGSGTTFTVKLPRYEKGNGQVFPSALLSPS